MSDLPQVVTSHGGLEVDHANMHAHLHPVPPYSPTLSSSKGSKGVNVFAEGVQDENAHSRSIYGLKKRTFWLLIATIAFFVIAASVAGGVGGSLATQDQSNTEAPLSVTTTQTLHSSATSTAPAASSATATDQPYVPSDPATVARIDNSCPSLGLTSFRGENFNCTSSSDLPKYDITGMVAYTWQACVDACGTMNALQEGNPDGKSCVGAVLCWDMSRSYQQNNGANCWLKSTYKQGDVVQNANCAVAALK